MATTKEFQWARQRVPQRALLWDLMRGRWMDMPKGDQKELQWGGQKDCWWGRLMVPRMVLQLAVQWVLR
jgi:hypothetical protein